MKVPILTLRDSERYKGCVIAYGHFNSVHPGHIRYLKHAAQQGKELVVAIKGDIADSQSIPFQFSQIERAEGLAELEMVDAIILLDEEENSFLRAIKFILPSTLVLGKEFEESNDTEIIEVIEFLTKEGTKTQFHGGDIQYATTKFLIDSESNLIEENRKQFMR